MNINIFLFEFKHFARNKAKIFSYLFFVLLCILSIYNGYDLMNTQLETISEIKAKKDLEINKILGWHDSGEVGPEDKPWVNITDPYWSIRYTPTYIFKEPSPLFPLGIGQAEQFGFYKKITRWSSTYDTDMVEEISNYERLINGNIDFSFLIIFLLPILLIILTYNINGMEKDLRFDKLIFIQNNKVNFWLLNRLLFYLILLIISINFLIVSVGFVNGFDNNIDTVLKLILISNLYIFCFALIFFFINKYSNTSSSAAFKMISIWLMFCVVIPGTVHQYASFKYPVNYMTDFLDINRKQTYEVFKLENFDLYDILMQIQPELSETQKAQDTVIDNQLVRRSISTIINQMNIGATFEIEMQNENKNEMIKSSYIINPVSYVQNLWNSCIFTDYYAYKDYRSKIQESILSRNQLIVLEMWRENKVNKEKYKDYLKILN